jgi:ribosomal protein S18 acetylase RimI-like enzyme
VIRDATEDDIRLVGTIGAAGFMDDPLMAWTLPDRRMREQFLAPVFGSLGRSFLDEHSALQIVDDACVTMWRSPSFVAPAPDDPNAESPFPKDVQERFRILGEMIEMATPETPHWYLNVIATLPERQGRGLGAQALAPMCARFDVEGVAAYLESSNPRNMTLYRRHGFEEINDPIQLPDGPALYPMWREPR